jgi:exodeoxyribonuclease VII large subunit
VAAAIRGFNALAPGGTVPRPELLIVARGGGSLEDLWGFNEEIVVRAVAEGSIPLISAVGHETDTTLIDYASDKRAPTPTAAAEMAVPVRGELLERVSLLSSRLLQAGRRGLQQRRERLEGLERGLVHPGRLLEEKTQRLDDIAGRLERAAKVGLERRAALLGELAARLVHPRQRLAENGRRLAELGARLSSLGPRLTREPARAFERLEPARRLTRAWTQSRDRAARELIALERLLEGYSYGRTLERGFAVVRSGSDIITRAQQVAAGQALEIEFAGEQRVAAVAGEGGAPPKSKPKLKKPSGEGGPEQGSLL